MTIYVASLYWTTYQSMCLYTYIMHILADVFKVSKDPLFYDVKNGVVRGIFKNAYNTLLRNVPNVVRSALRNIMSDLFFVLLVLTSIWLRYSKTNPTE